MHFNDITKNFVLIRSIKVSTVQIFKDSVPYLTVQESRAYRTVLMLKDNWGSCKKWLKSKKQSSITKFTSMKRTLCCCCCHPAKFEWYKTNFSLLWMLTAVNFINVLRTNFSYKSCFGSLHVTRENNVHMKNARV